MPKGYDTNKALERFKKCVDNDIGRKPMPKGKVDLKHLTPKQVEILNGIGGSMPKETPINLVKGWEKADNDLKFHGANGYSGLKIKKFLRKMQETVDREREMYDAIIKELNEALDICDKEYMKRPDYQEARKKIAKLYSYWDGIDAKDMATEILKELNITPTEKDNT